MADVRIDPEAFQRRLERLIDAWKTSNAGNQETSNGDGDDAKLLFNDAQGLLFVTTQVTAESPYQKSTSLQTWLFGYEFPNTLMYFSMEKPHLHVVASSSKVNLLEDLKLPELVKTYLYRKNQTESNAESFAKIANLISSLSHKTVGVAAKDKFEGKFLEEWQTASNDLAYETVDVSAGVGCTMAVKESSEIELIKLSALVSAKAMQLGLVNDIVDAIDDEKKVTHEELAEKIETTFESDDVKKRLKIKDPNFDPQSLESCYSPIVQSPSSGYDLKTSAISTSDTLQAGIILCALGARYKSYCTNIARTILIDPTRDQERNYEFLLGLQKRLVESVIKDGVRANEVYAKAQLYIRNNRPELEKSFVKNCGFATGLEFRESALLLSPKNSRVLRAGMVLNLVLGFDRLENVSSKKNDAKFYSLLLSDTVLITPDGAKAEILTSQMPAVLNDVSYFFNDEEEEKAAAPTKVKSTAIIKEKFRSEAAADEPSAEMRRSAHQHELFERRQQAGLERFADGRGTGEGVKKRTFRKFTSYAREDQLPPPERTSRNQIILDRSNMSLVFPIDGVPVPFHLHTLKNVTKMDEGDHIMLRFNFITPGQAGVRKEDHVFDDPNASFVRTLTYRSGDMGRLNGLYKDIQDLKKELTKQEAERKEFQDLVIQADLRTVKMPRRLPNVFARPTLDGKRFTGDLEIHENGIRYHSSVKHENRIDILFSNMKHFFFQPCEGELIVLLHVHLHNPIMLGKRKVKDIQFYREASDASFDETGNRRRRNMYGDEDELQAEQEERKIRTRLNKEFSDFADLIARQSNEVRVDVPFRDLGFSGVPFRANVLLQPTTDCLVQLSEPPFTVITLADVELVHLERVQFGLKNFDMVFIFSDFTKSVMHINSVPMNQLDNVKEWLDSMDIPYTEGPMNLNWGTIMKTINEDPKAFYEEGGWEFLKPEQNDGGSIESESASEFEMSSHEGSSSESDYSSEAVSSSDVSEESLSEEGEDWDELERKVETKSRHDKHRD